ncbi:YibE/F family protein [Clostridium tepidiprofundi]|uniref:YibE/F family protein n=1 Tax=Clostridium tepidiprofundi TaxID=420412 RepID=UPI0009FD2C6B|nr:YibE/F family protein [Clostridium tepidiprofundi]
MLLFMASNMKFREIINLDMVSAEIIRAIAGSIGLALTIPLTVIIAANIRNHKGNR